MKGHKSGHGRKGHEVPAHHGEKHKDGHKGARRGMPKTHGAPRAGRKGCK